MFATFWRITKISKDNCSQSVSNYIKSISIIQTYNNLLEIRASKTDKIKTTPASHKECKSKSHATFTFVQVSTLNHFRIPP